MLLFADLVGLCYAGFALLALSQDRNWRRVTDAAPRPVWMKAGWRVVGCGLLVLSLMLALWRDGPGFGSLLWFGVLSLAAVAVAITFSLRAMARGRR